MTTKKMERIPGRSYSKEKQIKHMKTAAQDSPMREMVKIPAHLDGFFYRQETQDWCISFSIPPQMLEYAQPLQFYMNRAFVLVPVPVRDNLEIKKIMQQ